MDLLLLFQSIKRYRRASLILRHLFSEAHTLHDKQILSKCKWPCKIIIIITTTIIIVITTIIIITIIIITTIIGERA